MNDSPQYEAFRAFARSEIRAARLELKAELAKELKDEFRETLTRSAPTVVEGPAGKDGKDGANGKDGRDGVDGKDGAPGVGERGADGMNGKDGAPGSASTIPGPKGDPGERGADGIATREELESLIEARFADLQVRSFADAYREVYKPGESYKRGEFVTWGGSLFLAKADTQAKPEQSPDWKLIVKRGADAKR